MTCLDLSYDSLLLLQRGTAFLFLLYALNCYILVLLHRRSRAKILRDGDTVLKSLQHNNS
jgi:hypothetical protein